MLVERLGQISEYASRLKGYHQYQDTFDTVDTLMNFFLFLFLALAASLFVVPIGFVCLIPSVLGMECINDP